MAWVLFYHLGRKAHIVMLKQELHLCKANKVYIATKLEAQLMPFFGGKGSIHGEI
jgi:hypothetical protein